MEQREGVGTGLSALSGGRAGSSEFLAEARRTRIATAHDNIRLTQLAIDQCAAGGGAANQLQFGTLICLALADFATHEVSGDDLLRLSRDFDVVFPWSLSTVLQTQWLDNVPFLIGVKQKYDPTDVFKFAQSIPLAL